MKTFNLIFFIIICCFCCFRKVTAYEKVSKTIKVQSWISYLHQFVQWFVSFNSLWLPLHVACLKRSYYLTTKWNKLWETILFLSDSTEYPLSTFLNICDFFCMTLSTKSQSLVAISFHFCYQYLNVVKAFFCLRARSSIMAQELRHLKFD